MSSDPQFAPVTNLAGYKALAESGELGGYHLLIASEVMKDPTGYQQFWAGDRGDDLDARFIIMDNGVIETGKSLPADQLIEAADLVRASCIVLPDVLGDTEATLQLAWPAWHKLNDRGIPLLGVVQGTSVDEVRTCVAAYEDMGVKYYSVPRVMTEIFGSRVTLVQWLRAKTQKPIHLLGFSGHLSDDFETAFEPGVMGIDSAVPFWIGRDLETQGYIAAAKRPKGYWDKELEGDELKLAIKNVRTIRKWLKPPAVKAAPTPQQEL